MGKYYCHFKEYDDNEVDGDDYWPSSVCWSQSSLRNISYLSGLQNKLISCEMIHLSSQDIDTTTFLKHKKS